MQCGRQVQCAIISEAVQCDHLTCWEPVSLEQRTCLEVLSDDRGGQDRVMDLASAGGPFTGSTQCFISKLLNQSPF